MESSQGSGTLSVDSFLKIGINLFDALSRIHNDQHLLHLDLRAANVIADRKTYGVRIVPSERSTRLQIFHDRTSIPCTSLSHVSKESDFVPPEIHERLASFKQPYITVDTGFDVYSAGVYMINMLTRSPESCHGRLPSQCLALIKDKYKQDGVDLPNVFWEILEKLAHDDPTRRYSHAHGVKHDLDRLWHSFCSEPNLIVGQADCLVGQPRFHDDKLYGREGLFKAGHKFIEETRSGAGPRLLVIEGPPGIGKSAFMRSVVVPQLTNTTFRVAVAKVDASESSVPYSALLSLVANICNQLSADTDNVRKWSACLNSALCGLGSLLVNRCPGASTLLGTQLELPKADAASTRFKRTLVSFLNAVSDEVPLALLLDDIQWADSLSHELLADLLESTQRILVVTTLRNPATRPSRPTKRSFQMGQPLIPESKRPKTCVNTSSIGGDASHACTATEHTLTSETAEADFGSAVALHGSGSSSTFSKLLEKAAFRCQLPPLSYPDVASVCKDVMPGISAADAIVVSEKAMKWCQGSPYELRQFLTDCFLRSIIQWRGDRWTVEEEQEQKFGIESRIAMLSPNAQSVLAAATFGALFDFDFIQMCTDLSNEEIWRAIQQAIDNDLVHDSCGHLRFSHDLVQEAVLSSIEPDKRRVYRTAAVEYLGLLLASNPSKVQDRVIMLQNINVSSAGLESQHSLTMAKCNLAAGKASKVWGPSRFALDCFATARRNLQAICKDPWAQYPDLMWKSTLFYAEMLAVTAGKELNDSRAYFTEVEEHCQTKSQHAKLYRTRAFSLANNPRESWEAGVRALRHCGLDMVLDPTQDDVDKAEEANAPLIGDHATFIDRTTRKLGPGTASKEVLEVLRCAEVLSDPAFVLSPTFSHYVNRLLVGYALKNTFTHETLGAIYGKVGQGMLVNRRFSLAYRYCKESLRHRRGPRFLYIFPAQFAMFGEPWRNCQGYFRECMLHNLQAGDYVWMASSACHMMLSMFSIGEGSDDFPEAVSLKHFLGSSSTPFTRLLNTVRATADLMREAPEDPGTTFASLRTYMDTEDKPFAASLGAWTCLPLAACGYYDVATYFATTCLSNQGTILHLDSHTEAQFSVPMTLLIAKTAGYSTLSSGDLIELVTKSLKINQEFEAAYSPNFKYRTLILQAELAILRGDTRDVMKYYEMAGLAVKDEFFPVHQAILSERVGIFLASLQASGTAKCYIMDAIDKWKRWGGVVPSVRLTRMALSMGDSFVGSLSSASSTKMDEVTPSDVDTKLDEICRPGGFVLRSILQYLASTVSSSCCQLLRVTAKGKIKAEGKTAISHWSGDNHTLNDELVRVLLGVMQSQETRVYDKDRPAPFHPKGFEAMESIVLLPVLPSRLGNAVREGFAVLWVSKSFPDRLDFDNMLLLRKIADRIGSVFSHVPRMAWKDELDQCCVFWTFPLRRKFEQLHASDYACGAGHCSVGKAENLYMSWVVKGDEPDKEEENVMPSTSSCKSKEAACIGRHDLKADMELFVAAKIRSHFDAEQFDSLWDDRGVTTMGIIIFCRYNLLTAMGIRESRLLNFLAVFDENTGHPFHNKMLRIMRLRLLFILLEQGEAARKLSKTEIFVITVATIVRDFRHPGKSNEFLAQSEHQLALCYNDEMIVENLQLAEFTSLLAVRNTDILCSQSRSSRNRIRKMVMRNVFLSNPVRRQRFLAQEVAYARGVQSSSMALTSDRLLGVLRLVTDEAYIVWRPQHNVKNFVLERMAEGHIQRANGLTPSPFSDEHGMAKYCNAHLRLLWLPLMEILPSHVKEIVSLDISDAIMSGTLAVAQEASIDVPESSFVNTKVAGDALSAETGVEDMDEDSESGSETQDPEPSGHEKPLPVPKLDYVEVETFRPGSCC